MPDLRESIRSAIQDFATASLRDAATAFFYTIGYRSERTMDFGSVESFLASYDPALARLSKFDPNANWQGIHDKIGQIP